MSNPNQDIVDAFEQQVWEKIEVKLNELLDTHITRELLCDELGLLQHQIKPIMDKLLDFYSMGCHDGYVATINTIRENHETI